MKPGWLTPFWSTHRSANALLRRLGAISRTRVPVDFETGDVDGWGHRASVSGSFHWPLASLVCSRCCYCCGRLFPAAWIVFGFALFAMSPTAILYAHSFKHYSSQLAMAPILLLAAVHCNRRPGPRNFALLLAAILVTALFSYPTVLLLPAVVILVGQPQSGESIDYSRVRQGMFASLWGLGVFGLLYVAVIHHNINSSPASFLCKPRGGRCESSQPGE